MNPGHVQLIFLALYLGIVSAVFLDLTKIDNLGKLLVLLHIGATLTHLALGRKRRPRRSPG